MGGHAHAMKDLSCNVCAVLFSQGVQKAVSLWLGTTCMCTFCLHDSAYNEISRSSSFVFAHQKWSNTEGGKEGLALFVQHIYFFVQGTKNLDKKVYALHKLYLRYTCSVFAVCNNFFLFDVHFVTCKGINYIQGL